MKKKDGNPLWRYALAVLFSASAVTVTRVTWPFLAPIPFGALLFAVAAANHWGGGGPGLLAVAITVVGSWAAFESGTPAGWHAEGLLLYLPVATLISLIMRARMRAAASLRANEAQLRATWEHATLGTALLDSDGCVERMNPALERLLGRRTEDTAGAPFVSFVGAEEATEERERFRAFIVGTSASYQHEHQMIRVDGAPIRARVTMSAIRQPGRQASGALAVVEDVTAQRQAEADLKRSEERLRRAQKMEAVGQLVAGVAHNFNNLLTITLGYADSLADPYRDRDLDPMAIQEIRRATERGAALTRQLLAFGRRHISNPVLLDVAGAVRSLRNMLTRMIREDIELTIDAGEERCPVRLDPYDFEQVVFNLVLNARDALPEGGTIRIEIGGETIDTSSPLYEPALTAEEFVRLRVRDNGLGMSPDVQAHLFEPFFTTKEVGEGTGLGLAFVHGIVRHAGGLVTVDSAPGRGTAVSIYLPRAPEQVVSEPPAATLVPEPLSARTGTILLVEDEESVLRMTTQVLMRAGYRVLPAATPAEARTMFRQHKADIDLLVSDVVMPEMHGPVLAEHLLAERPDLPVLFVSGHSETVPTVAAAEDRVRFLAKPFPRARFLETIAELLATTAA